MKIIYSPHAELKIKSRKIDKRLIESAIQNPDRKTMGKLGRTIFEKQISTTLKVRVIGVEENEDILVVTSYKTRVGRYDY